MTFIGEHIPAVGFTTSDVGVLSLATFEGGGVSADEANLFVAGVGSSIGVGGVAATALNRLRGPLRPPGDFLLGEFSPLKSL